MMNEDQEHMNDTGSRGDRLADDETDVKFYHDRSDLKLDGMVEITSHCHELDQW